jgi:hypothetical protein
MVKINFQQIEFDHLVEFTKDRTTFAAARQDSGHMRIFLAFNDNGTIYTRNGRADSWEELYGGDARIITDKIELARHNHIPVYRINGAHNN